MLANKLLAAMAGGEEKLYVDDVFSAYTRTGTGADVTVTTDIDMTKGYMLWSNGRSGATDHAIYDSARGVTYDLVSNSTAAQTTQTTGLKSVSSTGHTVGSLAKMNTSSATYVDWVFRKAPKFFDVVTYTGNGDASRVLSHAIDGTVGTIIIKKTSTTSGWMTWHRSLSANHILYMNTTAASIADGFNPSPTDTTFTVQSSVGDGCNASGVTYVAYLFAHDTGTDGLIQCGSFTVSSGTGTTEVNLGWEPQFLLTKYNMAGYNWNTYDSYRGWVDTTNAGNVNARLSANLSNGEASDKSFQPSATGFRMANSAVYPGSPVTILYLAIRRPNKPPTVGTQVYNAIARTGTGAAATVTGVGFAPDVCWAAQRDGASETGRWDRLRGGLQGLRFNTDPELAGTAGVNAFTMDGVSYVGTSGQLYSNIGSFTYINHFFKRAPGVFDVVCYTGTGATIQVPHNLGVSPELIILKQRSAGGDWWTSHSYNTAAYGKVNSTAAFSVFSTWNRTTTTFEADSGNGFSISAGTYVAYLFATKAGISKCGSYTGNATTNTIDCGFTTGARFVLIKRTDSTGDWYVWDTVRGIIAGNDPYLLLNSTTAEVTSTDYIDPVSTGFELSSTAPAAINASGGTFIYLAFA
mgnify:FL=1